jgi:hypothetical protein
MEQELKSTNNTSSLTNSISGCGTFKAKSYRDIELQIKSEINLNIYKHNEEDHVFYFSEDALNEVSYLKRKTSRKNKNDTSHKSIIRKLNKMGNMDTKETEDFNVNMLKLNLANNKNALEFDFNHGLEHNYMPKYGNYNQTNHDNLFINQKDINFFDGKSIDDFILSSINRILSSDNLKDKLLLYFIISNAGNVLKKDLNKKEGNKFIF